MKRYIEKILGYCPQHGWFKYPHRYRMNTQYAEEEMNYSIGCKDCQDECFAYYDDLWKDFYGYSKSVKNG